MLLWLLACLMALLPFATDLYLASLPAIGRHFEVPPSAVQLTMAAFIGAFGFGQLLAGPLSDRYGRRPLALGGSVVFTLAAVAASVAPSLSLLVLARLVQGLGTACTVIAARAVVRDQFEPAAGARFLGRAMALVAFAPLLGPALGGLLTNTLSWRANFAAMVMFSLMTLYLAWRWLPETNQHRNRSATRLRPLVTNYAMIARSRTFVAFTLTLACSFGALFGFIGGSSFVFIQVLGLSPQAFGIVFSLVTLGFMSGTALVRRLMPDRGLHGCVTLGSIVMVAGGSLMAGLALAGVRSVEAIALPMFVVLVGHGIVQPCCMMGAAGPFPRNAGAATALTGFVMNVLAASIAWFMGASFNGTPLPMALTICGLCVAVGSFAFLLVRPLREALPDADALG